MNKLKKKICALICAISVMGIVMLSSCKSNNYKVKFETFGGNEIDAAVAAMREGNAKLHDALHKISAE